MTLVHTIKRQLRGSSAFQSVRAAVEELRHPLALSKNVVMFHTGRCGSTVLGRMLNKHPDIYWAGEIFVAMPKRHRDVEPGPGALKTIIAKSRRDGRATGKTFYGFELKYLPQQHLRDKFINMPLEDCLVLLRRLRFSRFIVLHRENYLRKAISAEVGRHTGHWHARSKPGQATRVTLDLQSFGPAKQRAPLLELFRGLDENHEKVTRLLANDQVLHLSYERDIMQDPRNAYRKTCEFLGVVPGSPQIDLARTNPFSYDAMVANMPAVSALLQNTEYAWMLDA
jgi:LPS sulfotransferase NodH